MTTPTPPTPDDALEFAGWRFSSHKAPIATSAEAEAIAAATSVATLPEMVYPHNIVRVQHLESGVQLVFAAQPALARCPHSKAPRVQVAAARRWQSWQAQSQVAQPSYTPEYDWTYTTDYKGDVSGAEPVVDDSIAIDVDLLKRREAILWYADVMLFEDELHDHGVSMLSVRVRVMRSCFLVLLRHWLRVDGVLLRVADTRVFHVFGDAAAVVLREHRVSQVSFDELHGDDVAVAAFYGDVNAALPLLRQTHCSMEQIRL